MSVSDMEEKLFQKVAEIVLEEYPGSLVTHWTAAIGVVQEDGTEMVLTLDRPEQPIWQSMGLIDFAREMRRAVITNSVSDEHDDLE